MNHSTGISGEVLFALVCTLVHVLVSVYERNSFASYYCQFLSVKSVSVKAEITMTVIGQKQKFVNVQISVIETVIGGFCSRNSTEKG